MRRKFTKESMVEFLLIIGIFVFLGAIFVTNIFHFTYKVNADIASEPILAKLIWESKQIIPSSWYTSTEVKLIFPTNLAALIYGMGGNMNLAMGFACCITTMLILASFIFMLKSLEVSRKYQLLMVFSILILPNHFGILELIYLFVSYYAIHTVVLFFTLGVFAMCWRKEQIKWAEMMISVVLAYILGAQGVRGVLIIYGPLFGMEILRHLYLWYSKQTRRNIDVVLSIWIVIMLAVSFMGTMLPFSVEQGISRNIRKGFEKFYTVVISDIIKAIGFESTGIVGKTALGILLVIAIYKILQILFRVLKKDIIKMEEWIYLILLSSPIVTAFMVAFTTVDSSERYYYMFVFAMAYGVILVCKELGEIGRIGIIGLLIILAGIQFNDIYMPTIKAPLQANSPEKEVTDFLKAGGVSNRLCYV